MTNLELQYYLRVINYLLIVLAGCMQCLHLQVLHVLAANNHLNSFKIVFIYLSAHLQFIAGQKYKTK